MTQEEYEVLNSRCERATYYKEGISLKKELLKKVSSTNSCDLFELIHDKYFYLSVHVGNEMKAHIKELIEMNLKAGIEEHEREFEKL